MFLLVWNVTSRLCTNYQSLAFKWPLLIHHLCCVWSAVENSSTIRAIDIIVIWICFESKIWSNTWSWTCDIKLRFQICRGLNLRPFKRSIWLSNRILRVKTHTLAINWVCISVCPWFYLIFETDCSGVNIRQNWFIFTARLQTKKLSRNLSRKSIFNSEQYM